MQAARKAERKAERRAEKAEMRVSRASFPSCTRSILTEKFTYATPVLVTKVRMETNARRAGGAALSAGGGGGGGGRGHLPGARARGADGGVTPGRRRRALGAAVAAHGAVGGDDHAGDDHSVRGRFD
jgi:hypothetical protein